MLFKSASIDRLIATHKVGSKTRERLMLLREIRRFGVSQLSLPDNDSYSRYADIGRDYAVWAVLASDEFSIEPKTWCFPIVGCVPYRGYFSRHRAERFASDLKVGGLDVFSSGVPAYSTLGWGSDPVLNTVLMWPDDQLAGLIFHELAHQVVYVKNESAFNESFATFVEQEGLLQFLAEGENSILIEGSLEKTYQWYLTAREDRLLFRKLVTKTFDKMKILFAENISDTEKFKKKQQLFNELRENFMRRKEEFQVLSYNKWFAKNLNNSHLLGVKRYHSQVEKFALLFEEQGKQWTKFFDAVRKLAKQKNSKTIL